MTNEEIVQMLYRLVDLIRFADNVLSKHNCNDCGIQKTCKYCPNWGEDVRYNCPLWKERE